MRNHKDTSNSQEANMKKSNRQLIHSYLSSFDVDGQVGRAQFLHKPYQSIRTTFDRCLEIVQ